MMAGEGAVASPARRPAARRIAGNLSMLTLAEIFARTLTLVTSVAVARFLGPSKLGEVSLALALSVFCSAIADGGLTLLTYRRIVAHPNRISRLVVDTTMVQAGIGTLMMGLLIAIAVIAPFGASKRELLIVFAPYILSQALNVIYAVQALERMGSAALIKMATQLFTALPTIALVAATHDPVWFAVGLILGQLSGDAITFYVLRRRAGFRFVAPDLSAVVPLLRDGSALLGSLLLFNYLGSIDIPILSAFKTSHQVGEYSSATRIAATAAIVSQVLFTAVLPELVRRHASDHQRFVSFTKQLVILTTRLTLVPTAIVVAASGPIIHIIYGNQYKAAGPLLAILIPIVPLVWYGHLLGFVQVAAGRQRDFLVSLAVACATATVAYPLLAGLGGTTALASGGTAVSFIQAAAFAFLARGLVGDDAAIMAAVRQLPYALVPIGLILIQRHVLHSHSFGISVLLWLCGAIGVEAVGGWPTARIVASIRTSRGSGSTPPGASTSPEAPSASAEVPPALEPWENPPVGSASGSGRTVLQLITAGDVDAAAGFYDGRAPTLRQYFEQLCSPDMVDQATLAAFVDFRGRAATAPPGADPDELLRRAARAAAAGRLDLYDARSPECRATAELLVARMNGELTRSEEPLQYHLKRCSTCRQTAERLTDAEVALTRAGGEAPPAHIREAWLELVGREVAPAPDEVALLTGAHVAAENGGTPEGTAWADAEQERPEPEPAAAAEPATAQSEPPVQERPADQPEPPTIRVRTRRGGLVGAARRFASSTRRHQ
jgi:O-antigen/teichoic acid export membrane protein